MDFLTTIMLAFVVSLLLTSWSLWFYSIHINLFKIHEELRQLNVNTKSKETFIKTFIYEQCKDENFKKFYEAAKKEINRELKRRRKSDLTW